MIKYKLSEIAKNLNVPSKEISEVLKNYLNVNKKSAAVLTEQELNVIFEYYTDKTGMPDLNAYYASAAEPKEEAKPEQKPDKKDKQPAHSKKQDAPKAAKPAKPEQKKKSDKPAAKAEPVKTQAAPQPEKAEQTKKTVASLKEQSKQLEEQMAKAQEEMTTLLCQIPNIPYDEVPEGSTAEDNHVVKSNLKECDGNDTVGNWNVNPSLNIMNPLPHWELAKKYNLIDFDLGVKITGAGFPVYIGKGARLQRALINFFLDEARKSGYTEIMPPTVVNATSGYGTGQLPTKKDRCTTVR